MVVAIDAGEFQGQLILLREAPPAAEIAAEQGIGARADDELIGRIVAAAADDGALHGGQDLALLGAGPGQAMGLVERAIGKVGGLADIDDLGRALHQPQPADEVGGVDQACRNPRAPHSSRLPLRAGQPIGLVFDAELLARGNAWRQDGAQLEGRIGVGPVDPDADVLDDRGVLGLAQVGRAGEQHQGAVGTEIEALEEDVAEGVVAGQVEHALLTEA